MAVFELPIEMPKSKSSPRSTKSKRQAPKRTPKKVKVVLPPTKTSTPVREERVSKPITSGVVRHSARAGDHEDVTFNDYLCDLVIPANNPTATVVVNKWLSPTSFPGRIPRIAKLYELYSVLDFSVRYVPIVPTTTPGNAILAIDPDVRDETPSATHAVATLTAMNDYVQTPVWQECTLKYRLPAVRKTYFCNDRSNDADDLMEFFGQLYGSVCGPVPGSDTVLGQLFVKGTFRFEKRTIEDDTGGGVLIGPSFSTPTAVNWITDSSRSINMLDKVSTSVLSPGMKSTVKAGYKVLELAQGLHRIMGTISGIPGDTTNGQSRSLAGRLKGLAFQDEVPLTPVDLVFDRAATSGPLIIPGAGTHDNTVTVAYGPSATNGVLPWSYQSLSWCCTIYVALPKAWVYPVLEWSVEGTTVNSHDLALFNFGLIHWYQNIPSTGVYSVGTNEYRATAAGGHWTGWLREDPPMLIASPLSEKSKPFSYPTESVAELAYPDVVPTAAAATTARRYVRLDPVSGKWIEETRATRSGSVSGA